MGYKILFGSVCDDISRENADFRVCIGHGFISTMDVLSPAKSVNSLIGFHSVHF